MIVADLKQFTDKNKLIIYIKAFVELYNWRNRKQVYEIHRIVELEKIHALTTKHLCNFDTHCIIKYLQFCIVHILSLEIRKRLYFISITILTGINLTNYTPLIG